MNVRVAHSHSKQEAKNRIEQLIQKYKEEYHAQIQNLKVKWDEYRADVEVSAKGYTISGSIDIKDNSADIDLKIPFLLQAFNKKIKSAVHDTLTKALI
jgi:putative polyhydroxyalkanoate system protein